MDTKTPPIPLKYQEKKPQHKKQEKSVGEVSLPPLTPVPNGTRQKSKNQGTQWSRGTPYVCKDPDQKPKRPYRILHLGATPLMHACQQGDRSRVLRLLHDQEETIGYRDRTLRNALHYCMDAGTAGAVASAAPELVNAPDAEGHTPLHLAVIAGDTQLVAVLLANGADVNAKDLEGHSVLHWATVCGEAESVRLVLAAGARPSTPDLRGGSPLHYAAQCCGAAATAELSVPKKVGLKVLQTLLEFNADVNAKDEDGRQPILWAASAGSVEAVLALARAGGSAAAGATDKDGLTALHCAASRGHARCVEALVNLCGSQPDHVDDNGCSALHYAATLGHADATALLLRLGADPNRQDRKGRTPALCAAAKGQLETLKILAQHGGSLHARTIRGTGVAHEAVLSGRIELIEWLARKKPSTLDVATHDGRTPLHVAALHGYLDVCKVLLDHGARINAIFRTIKSGPMTPLDAALYRGHRDCAKLIQMHGGATSQHLRTHRTAPNRAKLKVKDGGSSSASDSESGHRNHRKADLYFEEHWIERRTRKRANHKRHDNRRGSRSYSEEEVRLSKASRRDRERRAKSESSRYKRSCSPEGKTCRRKHSKHEYSESSSELEGDSSGAEIVEGKKDQVDADDDRSLSDDSLEVVVVKRSLETKSEKVQYSGRKSKTPRGTSRETRVTETERRSSKKKLKSGKSRSKSEKKSHRKDENPQSEESRSKEVENSEDKGKKTTRFQDDTTDSTSQETAEQVTVTAMIHKDQASDTPMTNQSSQKTERKSSSSPNRIPKSKMDHMLEKADEMQNALMTKAADLKKDVEEIRRQMTEEVNLGKEENEQPGDNSDGKSSAKGRESDETESESNSEDSQLEVSRLQNQQEDGSSLVSSPRKQEQEESLEKKENSSVSENTSQDIQKVTGHDEEQSRMEENKTSPSPDRSSSKGKSSSRSKRSNSAATEVSASEKDSRQSSPVTEPQKTKSAEPGIEEKSSNDTKDSIKADEKKREPEKSSVGITEEMKREKKHIQSREELEKINEEKSDDRSSEEIHHIDSSSGSGKSSKRSHHSRPSTGKTGKREGTQSKSPSKASLFESSGENSPDRSAIVAVIESPEWDEEDEEVAKEIRDVVGDDVEPDTDQEDNDSLGVLRVLPSTSENSTPRSPTKVLKASKNETLPPVDRRMTGSPKNLRGRVKQRRDSGGRDSGIEPSPRVSKIPKRTVKCCPITEKQRTLNMDTITRDVQISLRRYHLERKIFFQLMELKRLQIRHGRANEQVLVKRQVEAFHKAGMSGPALGVAKYDQPLTFRHFETFLYEQLRHLQRRPATPDWCTGAKQCTQKTHRCHHATSAYTSVPIYTYLGGGSQEREEGNLLPKIESRGRGQMTVEVTRGEEKQIIALPAEKLDRTKRYYVTFTVRGESQDSEIPKTPRNAQRNTKSV